MNPRIWDLIYFRDEKNSDTNTNIKLIFQVIKNLEVSGYNVRRVSIEELDESMAVLPPMARWMDSNLAVLGIEGLYFPKSEHLEKVLLAYGYKETPPIDEATLEAELASWEDYDDSY